MQRLTNYTVLVPCTGAVLAAGWLLLAPVIHPPAHAQSQTAPSSQQNLTREDFDRMIPSVCARGNP
jgi:hypothetical protein